MKIEARPWTPQDLIDDLQGIIDEESDNYLNTRRSTLKMALAYLKEHFAEQKWIPVTERLPEDDLPKESKVKQIKVLVAYKTNGRWVVRTQIRKKGHWYGEPDLWDWIKSSDPITHWMPLPEPPEEG